MSAASSSSPLPSATVLTMNPPVCAGSPLTMARSRSRSASSWIRRDTPTWRDWGMKTMERPGMDTKEVTRAPLVPSDSFETCTRTSWPLRSISSMGATACRRGSASASPSRLALVHHVGGLLLRGRRGLVFRAELGGVVARVQKGVLGEPDVHERGLHAGQHVGDHALVDVPDDGAPVGALDVQLGEEISILDGETGFRHTGVDDDALSHGRPRSGVPAGDPASNYAVSGTAAFGSRSGDPALSARPPWTIRRSSSAAAESPRWGAGPSPSRC